MRNQGERLIAVIWEPFIRIQSDKHDSSSAHTHAHDMKELFESINLPERPVLVLSTDGVQDEAPHYPSEAISYSNLLF